MLQIRSIVIGVTAGAVLSLASPRAEAVTFRFENPHALDPIGSYDSCFGGEICGDELFFEKGGVSLTVSAFGRASAVIQDLSPSHGGLGAVREFEHHGHFHFYYDWRGDEVDRGQGLLLTFSEPVSLERVRFNNDHHGRHFDDCDTFRFSLDGESWETMGLDRRVWFDVPASRTFYFKYGGSHPDDFYIAGIRVTPEPQADPEPVPEPGTLTLVGAGLLGLALRRRRSGR